MACADNLPCRTLCLDREDENVRTLSSRGAQPQVGLAQMLKGGVIMDVTNAEEARIAEEAGE